MMWPVIVARHYYYYLWWWSMMVCATDGTSLFRQVLRVTGDANASTVLLNSNFEFIRDNEDVVEIASRASAKKAASRVRKDMKKKKRWVFRIRFDGASIDEFRVGLNHAPEVDGFCEFLSSAVPALRGAEYVILTVGTHGLGSPFHPQIRKKLKDECGIGLPQLVRTLEEKSLVRWFVSQHWPSLADGDRMEPGWNPATMPWPLATTTTTTKGACHGHPKLAVVPMGLAGNVRARTLAFSQVFDAMRRSVAEGKTRTTVETPFNTTLNLTFPRNGDDVRRPRLVSSAMQLHKGRKEKLEATGLRNELTTGTRPTNYHNFVDYFKILATSKFVLSPIGSGLDCFRHWEALALGAIPIVDYSPVAAKLFAGLPVLLMSSWDVPLANLDQFYEDHVVYATTQFFDFERLATRFWGNLLQTAFLQQHHPSPADLLRCRVAPFVAVCRDMWAPPIPRAVNRTARVFQLRANQSSCREPEIALTLADLLQV